MTIFDALNLSENDVVALAGGGGKTSIMLALGREAKARGVKAVLTTTTRIYRPHDSSLPVILAKDPDELASQIKSVLADWPLAAAGADLAPDGKIVGLDPGCIRDILRAGAQLVVVEADGAAHKPFKAPAGHEPVIPDSASVVMPVVGIDCLNMPLLSEHVHRPELAAELAGVKIGDQVTPEVVARVLTHPLGFLKGLPRQAQWIPFINKVETENDLRQAREIAGLVGKVRSCRVIIGAALRNPPVLEVLEF